MGLVGTQSVTLTYLDVPVSVVPNLNHVGAPRWKFGVDG